MRSIRRVQMRADAGSGPIEGDGGTWWAFTVAPPPTAVTVVPWGTTQTWIRWENEADDMADFHVERSTDGGAWSEIVQQGARSYLDASPTCGPVAYRVRAHWHGTNQFSEYGNVANVRACAPLAPGPLAVASWYGGTVRLTWEDRSGDESDFHIERQVDGGAWQAVVALGADSQAWVDEAPPCGVVGYRVRTHRHDSNQYSDYTNVASITRSCFDATTGLSVAGANSGPVGGSPIGRTPAAAWLALVTLAGLTLTGWRRRFRPAKRVATLALVAWLALLWPAAAAAQSAIEYYHTDVLGSVRAVTKQVNGEWQVVSRHDVMPFGEEVTPPSPPPPEKRLFTGKERDQETGLDYFEARYLRAGSGRFCSVDPLLRTLRPWDPQTMNRYAYTLNNPLRYVDRNGLYEEDVHRDLTQVLALAVGFTPGQAAAIAAADQRVDEDPSTSSGTYEGRRDYHFTTADRRDAMERAFEASRNFNDLGSFLHAEQDSYSHAGFGPEQGHILAGWGPDKTYNDWKKADRMALDTYSRLGAVADRLGREFTQTAWSKIDGLVTAFNVAKTPKEKQAILEQIRSVIKQVQAEQAAAKQKKVILQ